MTNSPDEFFNAADSGLVPQLSLEELNVIRVRAGLPPVFAVKTRRQRSVYLSDSALLGLQQLAQSVGMVSAHGGSVSPFLEALGQGVFDVTLAQPDLPPVEDRE